MFGAEGISVVTKPVSVFERCIIGSGTESKFEDVVGCGVVRPVATRLRALRDSDRPLVSFSDDDDDDGVSRKISHNE